MDESIVKKETKESDRKEMIRVMESVRKVRVYMGYSYVDFAEWCGLTYKAYYTMETKGLGSVYSFLTLMRRLIPLGFRWDAIVMGENFTVDMFTHEMDEQAKLHRATLLNHTEKAKRNREFRSHLL